MKMVFVTTDPAPDAPSVIQTRLRHFSPALTALVVTLGNPEISPLVEDTS